MIKSTLNENISNHFWKVRRRYKCTSQTQWLCHISRVTFASYNSDSSVLTSCVSLTSVKWDTNHDCLQRLSLGWWLTSFPSEALQAANQPHTFRLTFTQKQHQAYFILSFLTFLSILVLNLCQCCNLTKMFPILHSVCCSGLQNQQPIGGLFFSFFSLLNWHASGLT